MTQMEAMFLSMWSEAGVAACFGLLGGWRLSWRAGAAAVGGTALTHPVVWASALALYPHVNYWVVLALVECVPLFGEMLVYRVATQLAWVRCLGLSFAANAFSVALGILLQS